MEERKPSIELVEKKARLSRFKDRELLETGPDPQLLRLREAPASERDNELLEFLGDSVVGLIVAHHFYAAYPDLAEGELSKLKSTASSTHCRPGRVRPGAQAGQGDPSGQGRGEERRPRKKDSILAGVFEAVVGAIYLDGGFEAARDFVASRSSSPPSGQIRTTSSASTTTSRPSRSSSRRRTSPPRTTRLVSENGPDHDKDVRRRGLRQRQDALAKAKGSSRKTAEHKAAEKALKSFFGKKIKALTPETFIFKK